LEECFVLTALFAQLEGINLNNLFLVGSKSNEKEPMLLFAKRGK